MSGLDWSSIKRSLSCATRKPIGLSDSSAMVKAASLAAFFHILEERRAYELFRFVSSLETKTV